MVIFGIVIVSHGNLAKGFQSAANLIVGEHDLPAIGLFAGHDLNYFSAEIESTIMKQKEKYKDVLVFTDLMYGTPFNKVCMLMEEIEFAHFTGLSLPVLLETLSIRESIGLPEMVEKLNELCSCTFINVNQMIKEK